MITLKEQIEAAVYAPFMPVTIFRGWAWMDRPKSKRLRKKVESSPWRYRKYARPIYTEGSERAPAVRWVVLRFRGGR